MSKSKAQFQWDDPLLLEQQLTESERMVRDAARAYCQDKLQPRILDAFRHEKMDSSIFREMGSLGLLGATIPEQYGGSGLGFLRALRKGGDTVPVIILTAMDQLTTRIDGLNAGADDYLVKPFDLDELIARVAAVARRYAGNPNPLVAIGPLSIDHARRTASVDGVRLDLTAREWAVLDKLAQHPGVVVSRARNCRSRSAM